MKIEEGVHVGAVHNRTRLEERVTQSRLHLLTIEEAIDLGYQTMFPALVPTESTVFTEDLLTHVTPDIGPQDVVYMQLGESAVEAINAVEPHGQLDDLNKGQLIQLAEGISGHLAYISTAEANKVTCSINDSQVNGYINPEMPESAFIGFHIDRDGLLSRAKRIQEARSRIIVNLG